MLTTGRAPSVGAAPDELTVSGAPLAGGGFARERVGEIQRARLLAAMVEVACERGVGDVTVAHVVARAGVSRRTFYELFEDRDACLLAALEEVFARVSRCVLDAYDQSEKWVVRVRLGLIALLGFLDVERGAGWLLIVGWLGAGPRALERRKRVLAQMVSVIDEGRGESRVGSSGRGGAGLLPLTAEGVLGGVFSVLHARLLDAPSLPVTPDLRKGSLSALEHDRGDCLSPLEDEGGGSLSPSEGGGLVGLAGPLMSMIVLPYLGARAAQRELERPAPVSEDRRRQAPADPLRDVEMRLTYRTVRVLVAVAADPGCSNREVGHAAGVGDQGQISKLLSRLSRLGLIENRGAGQARGAPNAWTLTEKGTEIEHAIKERTSR